MRALLSIGVEVVTLSVTAPLGLESLFRDLRFGLRQLMRHRGFSVVAALAIALAIGANAAIFSRRVTGRDPLSALRSE